ncbi:ferrous iron transport protein B, partial [Escherichia coli 3.4880]
VERKEGQFSTTDHHVTLVDLPGTYSLTTLLMPVFRPL